MNNNKRVSIALTTYNGSNYILELLDSLRLQTYSPYEVIIVDDSSSDNTVSIVKKYIKKYNLQGWTIYENSKNLGWKKNFKTVISKTTGDYIFLADQDDIWNKNKIELFVNCLNKTDGWLAVSDFITIGSKENVKDVFMPKLNCQGMNKKIIFDKHYYAILRPGCVMAFNIELKNLFLKLWKDFMAHDALLWNIAVTVGKAYYINQPTIKFRRTGENASSKIAHNLSSQLNDIKMTQLVDEWYLTSPYKESNKICTVKQNLRWCRYRKKLLKNHKFSYWFKLLNYKSCYLSSKKYFGDVYYYLKSVFTNRDTTC